jgi:hypothetical protein
MERSWRGLCLAVDCIGLIMMMYKNGFISQADSRGRDNTLVHDLVGSPSGVGAAVVDDGLERGTRLHRGLVVSPNLCA